MKPAAFEYFRPETPEPIEILLSEYPMRRADIEAALAQHNANTELEATT
jgi:hypothetical protein